MTGVLPTLGQPTLLHGDCLDLLPTLEAESIDAIVTDPPAGIGFMHSEKAGRTWDSLADHKPRTERGQQVDIGLGVLGLERWARGFVVFLVDVFSETLRVVKPGAHALVWALPRTSDLTMLALRLSGWDVRDVCAHLFASGFPKSHDVSKAIDKMYGAEREVVGEYVRLGDSRPYAVNSSADVEFSNPATKGNVTAPATEDAKRHAGKGTALSPGHEQWILARAPLVGTVARNVLEYGTGAINIDATRTPCDGGSPSIARRESAARSGWTPAPPPCGFERGAGDEYATQRAGEQLGRWPKNAMLSCSLACEGDRHTPWCPVGELDRQSGRLGAGHTPRRPEARHTFGQTIDKREDVGSNNGHGDTGGASRFFPRFRYEAKASDRSVPGREDLVNKHETHKSPELMRWLVRLITPPGGVVLDQFMGSGTTGVAAAAEGCRFIGIEREAQHFEVARARNLAAVGSPEYAAEANAKAPQGAQLGLL
jgi:DNA modification methylase